VRRRAIEAINAGPWSLVPVVAVAAIAVGVLGALLLGQRVNLPGRNAGIGLALAGAVAGGVWLVAGRGRRTRNDFVTALLLAAAVVVVALVVPLHFLMARTDPPPVVWNHFGFLDKRWLTSLFMIATAGVALSMATAAQVVATARERPSSWRAWIADVLPARAGGEPTMLPPRRWARTALTLVAGAAFAAYFFAPPWHVAHTPLDYHEALTMGGVQAVRTGSLPYVDAAAVQYGPLAQLANVAYVGITGRLSVDGFREVTLLFQWAAATLFACALALRVRPVVALVTALAAVLAFPTLQTFAITSKGVFDGFWGWTDALRYAGLFVLAMAFPAIAARAAVTTVRMRAAALGVGWGVLCLLAQENLIGGALVLGILSVLLIVTDTIGRRAVLRTLGWIAVGMLLVAAPVCIYYAAHGRLGRFIEFYWLVPSAVARGYSNTVFPNATYRRLFYGVPFLLGGLLVAALLAGRPLRVARRWSDRRVVLVSALIAAVVSHLGSLTRSDAPHLVNTELALPAAVCLAAFDLPELLGARRAGTRWLGGIAIALLAVAVLPFTAKVLDPARTPDKLARPLLARIDPPAGKPVPPRIPVGSQAAARIGDETLHQRICCTKEPHPMTQLLRFEDRLHAVVGRRRVYVDDTGVITPPVTYFLADLRPAAFRQDYGTMVLNSDIRKVWLRDFRRRVGPIDAMVTTDPARTAPRIWTAAHPRYRTVVVPWAGRKVQVLLQAPPGRGQGATRR
jgi:hypothetical protein